MAYKISTESIGDGNYIQVWSRGSDKINLHFYLDNDEVLCQKYEKVEDGYYIPDTTGNILKPYPVVLFSGWDDKILSDEDENELGEIAERDTYPLPQVSQWMKQNGWNKTDSYFFFSEENGPVSVVDLDNMSKDVDESLNRIIKLARG